jgi:acyl-CoA reductase-like NAD-dependent aldehyde dehydrogenase
MKMYVASRWVDSPERALVKSPYSGETIDMVPVATPGQIEQALAAAEVGAVAMARLTAYDRNQILNRAAELIEANVDDLAQTISQESGR